MNLDRLPSFFGDFFLNSSEEDKRRLQPLINYVSCIMSYCLYPDTCEIVSYDEEVQSLAFAIIPEKAAQIEAALECRFLMKNVTEPLHLKICLPAESTKKTLENEVARVAFVLNKKTGSYEAIRRFSNKNEHRNAKIISRTNLLLKHIIDPGLAVLKKQLVVTS